jgi:large subunit ribosomal protein L10
MPKTEKVQKVEELTARFTSASGAVLADYRGLTVKDATQLRRSLHDADASFVVAKNTLARLAAKGAGLDELLPMLEGPTAIAFMKGDAVAGAKIVLEMSKKFPALQVKGALVDGTILGEDQAKGLASLESREVSLGKLAGMLQAPLARMIFLLQAPLQRMAYALAEHARQGGVDTSAPAEAEAEAAAEETPAAEEASAEAPAEAEAPAAEEAAEAPAAEETAEEPAAEETSEEPAAEATPEAEAPEPETSES